MKKSKLKTKTIFLFFLCTLWTGFIIWNASRTGEQSRILSDSITDTIKASIENKNDVPLVLEGTGAIYSSAPEVQESENENEVFVNAYQLKIFVRKTGHLLEYTICAFLASLALFSYGLSVDVSFVLSILYGIFIAISDETIQFFTYGRNGEISDVLIDTSGCIMGAFLTFIVVLVFICVKNCLKNKKSKEKSEILKKNFETD